jgi:hypothetical protein
MSELDAYRKAHPDETPGLGRRVNKRRRSGVPSIVIRAFAPKAIRSVEWVAPRLFHRSRRNCSQNDCGRSATNCDPSNYRPRSEITSAFKDFLVERDGLPKMNEISRLRESHPNSVG